MYSVQSSASSGRVPNLSNPVDQEQEKLFTLVKGDESRTQAGKNEHKGKGQEMQFPRTLKGVKSFIAGKTSFKDAQAYIVQVNALERAVQNNQIREFRVSRTLLLQAAGKATFKVDMNWLITMEKKISLVSAGTPPALDSFVANTPVSPDAEPITHFMIDKSIEAAEGCLKNGEPELAEKAIRMGLADWHRLDLKTLSAGRQIVPLGEERMKRLFEIQEKVKTALERSPVDKSAAAR